MYRFLVQCYEDSEDREPLGAGGWDDQVKWTAEHNGHNTVNTRTHSLTACAPYATA